MIAAYAGRAPRLDPSVFVVDSATVIGDVVIGPESSIWFGAVVRGDIESIRIGARTNVQDNATIHVVGGKFGTRLGDGVTVGHNAVVHGCTIEDGALVGMGAIVMNGAKIGRNSIVGAGSVITEGKEFPERSLIIGSPARVIRTLDDAQVQKMGSAARFYVANGPRFKKGLKRIG